MNQSAQLRNLYSHPLHFLLTSLIPSCGQQEGLGALSLTGTGQESKDIRTKIPFPLVEHLILCDRKHIQLVSVNPQGTASLPGEAKFLRN